MVKQMLSPVVCTHCGAIYDLCAVTPICRRTDCTTFKTPCCGRFADDRKWKGMPDIRPVEPDGRVVTIISPDGLTFVVMGSEG